MVASAQVGGAESAGWTVVPSSVISSTTVVVPPCPSGRTRVFQTVLTCLLVRRSEEV